MSIHKRTFIWGCAFGAVAVILGAFAAHGLKPVLEPVQLDAFQTGVRYQMYHALVLLFFSIVWPNRPGAGLTRWTGTLFIIGTCLFSGSIYLLSTRAVHGIEVGFLGPVTPLGGTALIAAWAMLLLQGAKIKTDSSKVQKN